MRLTAAITVILGLLLLTVPGVTAYQAPVRVRSRLEWVDRTGKQISILGTLADHGTIELSPDGTQVAVALMDPIRESRDVWLYDVASGRPDSCRLPKMRIGRYGRPMDARSCSIDSAAKPSPCIGCCQTATAPRIAF